jgi:hypothetical protein
MGLFCTMFVCYDIFSEHHQHLTQRNITFSTEFMKFNPIFTYQKKVNWSEVNN